VFSAEASAEPILQRRVSRRSRALATPPSQSQLAGERSRQGLPPRTIATVSPADSAGGSARVVVHGRGGTVFTTRASDFRADRGPAPSVKICRFFVAVVRAAGLLRGVRGALVTITAAFLLVRLSPGIAQRARSRSSLSATPPRWLPASMPTMAAGVAAAAVTSLAVVRWRFLRDDLPAPRRRRAGGFWFIQSVRSFPFAVGSREGRSLCALWRRSRRGRCR
jgi:hypothetical protein